MITFTVCLTQSTCYNQRIWLATSCTDHDNHAMYNSSIVLPIDMLDGMRPGGGAGGYKVYECFGTQKINLEQELGQEQGFGH